MNAFSKTIIAATVATAGTLSTEALAKDHVQETLKGETDNSFVSIRGTIVDTAPNSFVLDFGEDKVTVEVDDWDYDHEGKLFLEGDTVTVFGLVDNAFYQNKRIEAESIYVDDLNTTLRNFSAADEEDVSFFSYYVGPIDYDLEVMGEVTSTTDREFTIDTGNRQVRVDTIMMPYNPMDDTGFQQIDAGDYVRVSGDLDIDVFEKREIMAEMIVSID